MLTTFYGHTPITLDVHAEVEWMTTNTRRVGEATIRITRDSPAWDSEAIHNIGGFFVQITTPWGIFPGIADAPEFEPEGIKMQVRHINAWPGIRVVGTRREFYGVTAGSIVRRAVIDSLIGLGSVPITIGSILEAPPIINEYHFTGNQHLSDVLTDLGDETGHQWIIDNNFRFNWRHRIGQYHEFWVVDDGKFLSSFQHMPLADQFAESIEVDDSGGRFTARNEAVSSLWPSQQVQDI